MAVLATQAIANVVKSSLGPVGLDKMLVDDIGVSSTVDRRQSTSITDFLLSDRMLRLQTTARQFSVFLMSNIPPERSLSSLLSSKTVKLVMVRYHTLC